MKSEVKNERAYLSYLLKIDDWDLYRLKLDHLNFVNSPYTINNLSIKKENVDSDWPTDSI